MSVQYEDVEGPNDWVCLDPQMTKSVPDYLLCMLTEELKSHVWKQMQRLVFIHFEL